jgi:hypothetical protein
MVQIRQPETLSILSPLAQPLTPRRPAKHPPESAFRFPEKLCQDCNGSSSHNSEENLPCAQLRLRPQPLLGKNQKPGAGGFSSHLEHSVAAYFKVDNPASSFTAYFKVDNPASYHKSVNFIRSSKVDEGSLGP